MDRSLPSRSRPIPKPSGASWEYWRPAASGIVELGTLHGREVGLPTHFHDEDQITFVIYGRRGFFIGGEVVGLPAGQGCLIPAGIPHSSLPEPSDVACINAYVPTGDYAVAAMVRDIERIYRKAGTVCATELARIVLEHRHSTKREHRVDRVVPTRSDKHEPVAEIAARAGMSREGFSRLFARLCGMPPHAFWLMRRLNEARALLRAGEAIAEVAAEAGFADQSHLTRCFRRAFGVTPGRFRSR